jgi:hypothetical protein
MLTRVFGGIVTAVGACGRPGGSVAKRMMKISYNGIVAALRACGPYGVPLASGMKKISYAGYRFPPEIIQQAI